MTVGVIVTLIILGIFLLLVELLIIPGITVAGIVGTIMIIGGVFCGYYFHEASTGHYILISTFGIIVILFITALKTKTWQKMGLNTSIEGHLESVGSDNYEVGQSGKSISRLAPIGKIMVNDTIIEARSLGGYIDPNVDIVIVKTEKNKIFVEPK